MGKKTGVNYVKRRLEEMRVEASDRQAAEICRRVKELGRRWVGSATRSSTASWTRSLLEADPKTGVVPLPPAELGHALDLLPGEHRTVGAHPEAVDDA